MARQVGDLWPYASGTASLGAEQLNGEGGFSNEYRPFAHVHMNSGVFHGALGESGVLRFAQGNNIDSGGPANAFEVSLDGGLTYAPLLTGLPDPHTLQAAYDGGDEIQLIALHPTTDFGPSFEGKTVDGVVLKEPLGAYHIRKGEDKSEAVLSYALAVSGVGWDPDDLNLFGLVRIGQQCVDIRSSGTNTVNSHNLFLGFDGNEGAGTDPLQAHIYTSGKLRIESDKGLRIVQNGSAGNIAEITLKSQTVNISLGTDGNSFNKLNFLGEGTVDAVQDLNLSAGQAFEMDAFDLGDPGNGSGQLKYRFGPYEAWHTTVGAGNKDLVPIAHSGHVVQMIAELAPGGSSTDLQGAYDNGNEIDADFGGPGYHGVLVRELRPGAPGFSSSDTRLQSRSGYGIAVSGFTATPDNIDSYAFTRLTSHGLHIQGSGYGSPAGFQTGGDLFIGAQNYGGNSTTISTSGSLVLNVADNVTWDFDDTVDDNGSFVWQNNLSTTWTFRDQMSWSVSEGNALAMSQIGVKHLGDFSFFGDNNFWVQAFGGSGNFRWKLGPNEGLAVNLSHESAGLEENFHPLPHSGQIVQMILEQAPGGGGAQGLQVAYDADPTIVTDGATPVTVIADDHVGARFSPIGETAGIPISLSGFIQRPTTAVEQIGDMFMFQTMFGSDGRPQRGGITTPAEAQALSLGPGVPAYNSGSGIMPVAIASGVSQFINISVPVLPDDTVGREIPWHSVGNQFPDRFFHVITNDEYVTIMVPGFYMAQYKASFHKIDGNERTTVESALWLNGLEVLGGTSSAYLRNTVDRINTANGVCLFNAEPGDQVAVHVAKVTNVSDGVQVNTRECTLVLQYLGPPRGGISAT